MFIVYYVSVEHRRGGRCSGGALMSIASLTKQSRLFVALLELPGQLTLPACLRPKADERGRQHRFSTRAMPIRGETLPGRRSTAAQQETDERWAIGRRGAQRAKHLVRSSCSVVRITTWRTGSLGRAVQRGKREKRFDSSDRVSEQPSLTFILFLHAKARSRHPVIVGTQANEERAPAPAWSTL